MSIRQTFPDVVVMDDGILHLITWGARSWAYQNTTLKQHCTVSTIPRIMHSTPAVVPLMAADGLVVSA